jgi:hypothetical protein
MSTVPTRVCIIGNSHIAALKLAIRDGLFRSDGLEVVFWGVTGNGFQDIVFDGGRLVSPDTEFVLRVSDGRYETIDPDAFDAIVIHGPAVRYTRLFESLRHDNTSLVWYSAACLREGVASWIEANHASTLIRAMRGSYKGRIVCSPMPLIAAHSGHFKDQQVEAAELDRLDGVLGDVYRGIGAEYLPQPRETVTENKYTIADYSIGSVRLGGDLKVQHGRTDFQHMNAQYGRLVLEKLAAHLAVH